MRNLKICNLQSAICNAKKGLTLIELMIALFITSIAMGAVYTTFIVQQRSFGIQDQVSETQVSSNIASNIIVNDLRMAGFGYPIAESPSINGFTNIIDVSGESGPNGGPDSITLVGGFRQVATLASPSVVGQTSISINYVSTTYLNLTNKDNITIDGIYFATIDPTNSGGCTLSAELDCVDSSLIYLDRGVSKNFPFGRPVYLVEDITYQIVTATGSNCGSAPVGTTCLEKSVAGGGAGYVDTVANYIEDLQFAYAVDADSDGQIDDQNGNSVLDPGDYLLTPPLPQNYRILAIRMNLLASTAYEDQTLNQSTKPYYPTITLENNDTDVNDKFRRRIWSMEIALRNAR